jgi:hypothetical protein
MALSSAERAKVRKYLGWGARFFQVTTELEQAMDTLGTAPDDETEVREELLKCQEADEQMKKVFTTALAIQVGAIRSHAHYQLGLIRSMGTQAAARIASILEVPLKNGGGFSVSGPTPL